MPVRAHAGPHEGRVGLQWARSVIGRLKLHGTWAICLSAVPCDHLREARCHTSDLAIKRTARNAASAKQAPSDSFDLQMAAGEWREHKRRLRRPRLIGVAAEAQWWPMKARKVNQANVFILLDKVGKIRGK